MTPAHMHANFEELFSAGELLSNTEGLPGAQGAVVAGTHGMGVKTPLAAAVALATCGFAIEEHIPNGITLTIGTLSMMLALSSPETMIGGPFGMTISDDGAVPNEH